MTVERAGTVRRKIEPVDRSSGREGLGPVMSDSFDNLLARTEHRDTAPAGPCPDAEVLAAYLDATLTPAERDGVEAHAADCGRCALQLGTVVRLEDVSGAPQHAPVRRWSPRLAWMVPAVTAVLVGAVYVALPSRGVAPEPPAPPPAQRPASNERAELKQREASNPPALNDRLEESNYRVLPPPSTAPPSAKSLPSAARAPAPRTNAPPGEREPAATEGASTRNSAAPDAALTTGELRRRSFGQSTAPSEADVRVDAGSADRSTRVEQLRAAEERADLPLPLVVRSPAARVQWRVVEQAIQRSTDAGRTWGAEPAPPAEAITMGAAPSPEVCWMAGADGQVLRRSEDGTWVDVSPAPRISIVRLDVSTSLEAAVIRPDGTALKTADGGRTWLR
jgi:hypothetical protein